MQNFGAKLKNFFLENSTSIFLWLIINLSNVLLFALEIHTHGLALQDGFLIAAIIFFIILSLLSTLILYLAKKKTWKIEKIYLFCALLLGLFYVIAIPLGGAPDESSHFWRAYELSEDKIIAETNPENGSTGFYIPDNLQETTSAQYAFHDHGYQIALDNASISASDNYELTEGPADSYAFFNYIPQTLGILLGKIFQLPLVPMMYLSRICNLLFCILITYFCIKYVPAFKKVIFLVALFPMTMQLFASVSADGSIICAGLALVTFVLYARKGMKRLVNQKDLLLLLLSCLVLIVTKPVYALMCPLMYWIPDNKFRSRKQKIVVITILLLIVLSVLLAKFLLVPTNPKYNPGVQMDYIVGHPISFAIILFKNIVMSIEPYYFSIIGEQLEWFSVKLALPYITIFFIFFILLCAERKFEITKSLKYYTLCAFAFAFLSTYAIMFLQWTPPGATTIDGVQGRYFIPILLLIPLFWSPTKRPQKLDLVRHNYLYIFTIFANIYTIATIFCAHI